MNPLIVPSVTDFLSDVKKVLEDSFRTVSVEGEISNLTRASTGHLYFTLKDSQSSLRIVMFKADAARNLFARKMKNGDKVVCTGSSTLYKVKGDLQLICKRVSSVGKGDLNEKFNQLKQKLAGEGLFDLDKKKDIPKMCKRIGVITSGEAAALQDFKNIVERRSFDVKILLSPSLVQGESAAESMRKALYKLIKYHIQAGEENKLDVIVLTRGGGSLEDLWAFNDEALVWDIYNCPIPVISAVGHEVDYTLTDYVSDYRAETPSAAAEIVSQYQFTVMEKMFRLHSRLNFLIKQRLRMVQSLMERTHPKSMLGQIWKSYAKLESRLLNIDLIEDAYKLVGLADIYMRFDEAKFRLEKSITEKISIYNQVLVKNEHLLTALSPKKVLSRGYTFLESSQQNVIGSLKEFEEISTQEILEIHFKDGKGHVRKLGQRV